MVLRVPSVLVHLGLVCGVGDKVFASDFLFFHFILIVHQNQKTPIRIATKEIYCVFLTGHCPVSFFQSNFFSIVVFFKFTNIHLV